jgi:hypothetical protein
VSGSLGALPLKDVGSVFGFDKTLAETPRGLVGQLRTARTLWHHADL